MYMISSTGFSPDCIPDGATAAATTPALTAESGRGIRLLQAYMAELSYYRGGAVLRMGGQRKDTSHFTIAGRPGAPRTVIVERRAPRRVPLLRPTTASAGYRGRI